MRFLIIIILFLTTNNAYADHSDKHKANEDLKKSSRNFISNLTDDVLTIIKDKKIPNETKEKRLVILFNDSVDSKWIGKFVIGKYWKSLGERQNQYLKLYEEFLFFNYASRFTQYDNEEISILKSSQINENDFKVSTEILVKNKPSIAIDYYIRQDKASKKWVIYDIVAEGISHLYSQRAEFDSVINRKDIDFLMDRLKLFVDRNRLGKI